MTTLLFGIKLGKDDDLCVLCEYLYHRSEDVRRV